jgi:hypothetical protein
LGAMCNALALDTGCPKLSDQSMATHASHVDRNPPVHFDNVTDDIDDAKNV